MKMESIHQRTQQHRPATPPLARQQIQMVNKTMMMAVWLAMMQRITTRKIHRRALARMTIGWC